MGSAESSVDAVHDAGASAAATLTDSASSVAAGNAPRARKETRSRWDWWPSAPASSRRRSFRPHGPNAISPSTPNQRSRKPPSEAGPAARHVVEELKPAAQEAVADLRETATDAVSSVKEQAADAAAETKHAAQQPLSPSAEPLP